MFRETVEKVQPLLVLISETHVIEEEAFQQFHINGYRVVSCLSHSRHTGGVAVYARSEIVLKCYEMKTFRLSVDRINFIPFITFMHSLQRHS